MLVFIPSSVQSTCQEQCIQSCILCACHAHACTRSILVPRLPQKHQHRSRGAVHSVMHALRLPCPCNVPLPFRPSNRHVYTHLHTVPPMPSATQGTRIARTVSSNLASSLSHQHPTGACPQWSAQTLRCAVAHMIATLNAPAPSEVAGVVLVPPSGQPQSTDAPSRSPTRCAVLAM